MNDLDQKILAMLVDDGRMSFADIARELNIPGCTRATACSG